MKTLIIPESKINVYTIGEIIEKFPKALEKIREKRYEEIEPFEWSENLIEDVEGFLNKIGFGEVTTAYSCSHSQGDGFCFYHLKYNRIDLSQLLKFMTDVDMSIISEYFSTSDHETIREIFSIDLSEEILNKIQEEDEYGNVLVKITKTSNYTHENSTTFEKYSDLSDEIFRMVDDALDSVKTAYKQFCRFVHKKLHESLDYLQSDEGLKNYYSEISMFNEHGKEYPMDEIELYREA